MPEFLNENGMLHAKELSFLELKNRSKINKKAKIANQDINFSLRIRESVT